MSTDLRLEYENVRVKLVALRKIPRTETPGVVVEEVEEKREFSAPHWVAQILVESGLARMIEDGLTPEEWTQTHFKERFNPAGPPSILPKDFYRRAYISFIQAKKEASGDQTRAEQLNRLQARFRDILESRISKITRLAAAEMVPQPGVLQTEEHELYQELESLIAAWRKENRQMGER